MRGMITWSATPGAAAAASTVLLISAVTDGETIFSNTYPGTADEAAKSEGENGAADEATKAEGERER